MNNLFLFLSQVYKTNKIILFKQLYERKPCEPWYTDNLVSYTCAAGSRSIMDGYPRGGF